MLNADSASPGALLIPPPGAPMLQYMNETGAGPLILVVDDEAINRLLLVTALRKRGYGVIEADGGEKALQLAFDRRPDLVLLDVMMPELTGFEVCRRIKEDPSTRTIPVVLVTALHSHEDVERGIAAGADEFISKPVDISELMVRVRMLLKMGEMKRLMEGGNPGAGAKGAVHGAAGTREADHLVSSFIAANIASGPLDRLRPASIHLQLRIGGETVRSVLFTRTAEGITETPLDLTFSDDQLAGAAISQEDGWFSNFRQSELSREAYMGLLPADFGRLAEELNNFICCRGDSYRFIFLNFGREVKLFDLTWYRHMGSYFGMLLALLTGMGEKEAEYLGLIRSLGALTEIKDGDRGKHARIRRVCALICRRLDCTPGYAASLLDAVELYDIGKLMIDESILAKSGPLSDREWGMVRRTPLLATWMFEDLPRLSTAREIAVNLYENYDGSGYPVGRKGEEIPFSARLLRVADVYESLRVPRSYRRGYTHAEAFAILKNGDGRLSPAHFDPVVLKTFLELGGGIKAVYEEGPNGMLPH